jgi:putative Mg2+ transporter-C (MgtC) family protein
MILAGGFAAGSALRYAWRFAISAGPAPAIAMEGFSLDLFLRLLCGVSAGAVIGLDRKLRGKPSGMRTLGLVSLGAAAAVIIVTTSGHPPDAMSRVLQGLLTGIGFLGAGVIVHHGERVRTQGLTTAAAIWVAAVLGAASGAGYYGIVAATLVLALALLFAGGMFESAVGRLVDRAGGYPGARRGRHGPVDDEDDGGGES